MHPRGFLRRITEKDQELHNWVMGHFPKALPAIDWSLERLFSLVTHPAFGIIVAFMLVALVATNVINVIVAASIGGAWFVALIWIARSNALRGLTILSRWLLVSAIGIFLGFAGNRFGNWASNQYNQQKLSEQGHQPAKQNAYVSIDKIEVGLLHNRTTLGMNIYVKNTTTSLAKNEIGIFQILAIPTTQAEKVEDKYPSKVTLEKSWEDFEKSRSLWEKMQTITLGPGEGAWGTGSIENVDDQLWRQFRHGEEVVLIMHVVLFTDDAGPHEIDSCRWIQPPFTFEHQTWRFCSVHNGIKY
jgi:hypothetical protein